MQFRVSFGPLSLVLVLALSVGRTSGFCWQMGKNPEFTDVPKVEQVDIDLVRVSWQDLVEDRECADQFLVKYWRPSSPADYDMTDLLSNEVNHVDIKVIPKVPYVFEVVAREDKGILRGIEYNKSEKFYFKTSSHNVEVRKEAVPPKTPVAGKPDPEPETAEVKEAEKKKKEMLTVGEKEDPPIEVAGLGLETFIFIVVAGLVILLIVVGVLYTLVSAGKKKMGDDDEEEDGDNDEDDVEKGSEEAAEVEELAPEKNVS